MIQNNFQSFYVQKHGGKYQKLTFSNVSMPLDTIFTWISRGGSTERYVICLSSAEMGFACEYK